MQLPLISELIRNVVHKADAFGMKCFVMSTDIRRAFQGISHEWAQRAMRRFQVPAHLRKVILEELAGLRCSASLPGATPSQYCPYSKGGREGGVDTPSLFNLLLEERLDEVVRGWTRDKVGFPLADFDGRAETYLSHAVWADNIYLFASSQKMLAKQFSNMSPQP